MNWKEWLAWKEKKYIAIVLFIVAYVLTIPIRDYEFLDAFIDTTQGVPIWAHLIIIVVGSVVLIILLKVIEIIVKYLIKK
ncbi:MAG: hypothetical protein WBF32_08410 [Candidatus Aminicenantaceae bacterium]